jgi:hypothetical protein
VNNLSDLRALHPDVDPWLACPPHQAQIGLRAEADGDIPGPIKRAPLDQDGRDQGEFIDADERKWDVKSSPDLRPSYAANPGKPIRYPQSAQEFTDMIDKELSKDQGILLDPDGMTPGRLAQLKAVTSANVAWQGR